MNSLVQMFVNTWLHPTTAMMSVKQEGDDASLKPYMLFVVIMGLISGLITAVAGMFLPAAAGQAKWTVWLAVPVVPLISFIGSFIGAFIIWWLVDGILKGTKTQYKSCYRLLALLAAFSPVSALLAPIPTAGQWLAIAINIWATVVMIRGIILVRDTPVVRTWVTCVLLFGFLFSLGLLARLSAQRQAGLGGPGFSDLDLGDDTLGGTNDSLNDQLQGLAEQQKAGDTKTDRKAQ